MVRKAPGKSHRKGLTFIEVADMFRDEETARDWIAAQRWPMVRIGLSADRLTDQQSGEFYYEARVMIPQDEIDKLGDVHLVPGMPAEVMILTGESTALAYLLDPLIIGFSRAFKE